MVNKAIGLKVMIMPLTLALVVMLAVFFIKPLFSEMMANRSELKAGNQELSALQEQSKKLDQLKQALLSLEDRNLVAVALPENEDIEDYLNEFYQRAARSGVLVKNFSVSQSTLPSQFSYTCGTMIDPQTGLPITGLTASSDDLDSTSGSGVSTTGSMAVPSCVQDKTIDAAVTGNWDQILNFYKYIFDTNRIANIRTTSVSVSSKISQSTEGEVATTSDLLDAKVTFDVYYKAKNKISDSGTINALAGSGELKTDVLRKLADEIIYSPYEPPSVSESDTKNIFR